MAPSNVQELFAPNKGHDADTVEGESIVHHSKGSETLSSENERGVPHMGDTSAEANPVLENEAQTKGTWFAYVKTKQFWIAMVLGQILAICITSTNTLSSLLSAEGTSIPAFQSFFNYVLLNIVYTSYTIYKYGFKGWAKLLWKDGWRFFILAFFDVEGNYFIVLAYRYVSPPYSFDDANSD